MANFREMAVPISLAPPVWRNLVFKRHGRYIFFQTLHITYSFLSVKKIYEPIYEHLNNRLVLYGSWVIPHQFFFLNNHKIV